MKKEVLIEIAKEVFNEDIKICLQTETGKWYETKYTQSFEDIECEKTYGIAFDNTIYFDFKAGKNEDNFIKSFITQFISKYETKKRILVDGEIVQQTKIQVIERLKNSERVWKSVYYTTLYGIGYFCFLSGKTAMDNARKNMDKYLHDNNIEFKNEYSEAQWVYRYLLKKDVNTHNEILRNFKTNN